MQQRVFGRTGWSVSPLGFGGAPIGFLETEQQRVEQVLNLLLDSGVNVIDTAASYVGSEEAIGRAISHRRGEYLLVSKCGQRFDDLPGEAWSAEVVTATVDRALQRLRTDHLDVMLLHSGGLEMLQKGEALGALVAAREAGKIGFAGYSGDNEAAAYAVTLPDIAVLETSVNFCDQANLEKVLPAAVEHEVGVIAKRPIANTAWRPLDQMQGLYQSYARPYRERFEAMGLTLSDLGLDESQIDWSELALRFTLSQPGVHVAIVGTSNPEHVKRNLEIADREPLGQETIGRLRDAFRRAEAASGERWTAQT
ncbi:MAG: aldo/keto reductase [Armatimonadetes bacterium]|nr:aldo/keto reductase [Armatimonadota bacterium]